MAKMNVHDPSSHLDKSLAPKLILPKWLHHSTKTIPLSSESTDTDHTAMYLNSRLQSSSS